MRTFSLGEGNDTIIFAATADDNGKDTITGFTEDNDMLDFTAFATLTVGELSVASTANQALVDNKIYQTTVSGDIASKNYGSGGNGFDDLFGTSGKAFKTTDTTNGNKELIVVKGNDVTQIYYVEATDTTLTADMVDLVAVISNNNTGVVLTEANFA